MRLPPNVFLAAALLIGLVPTAACSRSSTPRAATAAPPPATSVGVTERQGPEPESPSPSTGPGTILLPSGATMVGSEAVREVRAVPPSQAGGHGDATVGVDGVDSLYATDDAYADTVAFYDRSLASGAFQVNKRLTTTDATIWAVRTPKGTTVFIAVHRTTPTTVEMVDLTAERSAQ